jgi:hypothetical protein
MSALAKPDPSAALTRVKDVGGPLAAAGAAALGLAGGVALGSRLNGSHLLGRRRTVLGVPVGRKSALETFCDAARHLASAANSVSSSADDVREVRAQLEQLNKRSPVEVLLDGLTHRRGAHKRES